MAFTYDITTDRGKVRFMLDDTVEASALFSDAEVDWLVSYNDSDLLLAAAMGWERLAGKYSKLAVSKSAGNYSEDLTRRAQFAHMQADRLRDQAAEGTPAEDFIEWGQDQWGWSEFVRNEALRDEV